MKHIRAAHTHGRGQPALAEMRREYESEGLDLADLDADPIRQFEVWFRAALEAEILDANAMTLATASADGEPAARTVLLKAFDERGFVFFTSYASDKARHLESNPRGALLFYWQPFNRQVRICGDVERTTAEESRTYFQSRPRQAQLSALASEQSAVVPSRAWLERQVAELATQNEKGRKLAPGDAWGGYRLSPRRLEFWQGRPNRLHDRFRYRLDAGGDWRIERLAP